MTFEERKIETGDTVAFTETLGPYSCISLTTGREYEVLNVNRHGWVKVENDRAGRQHYKPSRFTLTRKGTPTMTFSMKLNPSKAPYPIEASAPKGVLRIKAGCFEGTLAEAYDRANGRTCYVSALNVIKASATALDIRVEPEKTYNVELTQAECDALAVLLMRIGGCPTTSLRRECKSIRMKLEEEGIDTCPDTTGKATGSINMLS